VVEIPATMFLEMPGFLPAAADEYLKDEQVLDLGNRTLRVLHTPGHAPGHCCFALEDDRIVLTGDHILPKITPHVGFFPGGDEDPLGDFLDSLKRVAEQSYRLALPAHGEPFLDPASRVGRLVRHHEFRLTAIIDALGKEPKTAWDVVPLVFGELPDIHKFAALFETLSHLVYSAAKGDITRFEDDGKVFWKRREH
jgi:glyoxylase-like metal-dependent hydrolase (beta-lactamase superfamily II)